MRIYLLLTTVFFITTSFAQVDQEWDDYFMPGLGVKSYIPKNHSEIGVYNGIMTEFVIYAKAKGSVGSGPSRIKTYGNLSIMGSSVKSSNDIFFANVGLNLSYEGKLKRKYLIPYFGLEIGGLFQRDFSTFQFSPVTGIQIVSNKRILWSVQGGYLYTTKRFDEYSGFSLASSVNVLLWNN